MPSTVQDRGTLPSAPGSPSTGLRHAAEPLSAGGLDYDPLSSGRGLVFGLLFSTILLCGIVALAMLIWAT
jgi:hypothetical protein